jgi:shikimate 5-dehydrogenase
MRLRTLGALALLTPVVLGSGGCATAVIAGAAAAGGYIAHEKGYRVRNPVTKSRRDKREN